MNNAQIFCLIMAMVFVLVGMWGAFKTGYLLGMRRAWDRVEVKRKMTIDARTREIIADRMIVTQAGPAPVRVFFVHTEMTVAESEAGRK